MTQIAHAPAVVALVLACSASSLEFHGSATGGQRGSDVDAANDASVETDRRHEGGGGDDRQGGSGGTAVDGSSSDIFSCPRTLIFARLVSGTITFSLDGAAPQTRQLAQEDRVWRSDVAGSNRCTAGLFTAIWPDTAAEGGATVDCYPVEGWISVGFFFGDTRTFAEGTYAIGKPQLTMSFETASCSLVDLGGSGTITFTHAAGGPAPYPAAVTSDFSQELVILGQWDGSGESISIGPSCPRVRVSVELHFVETAANAVNEPDERCAPL